MGCLNVVVTQVNAPTIAVGFTRIGGCSAAVTDVADHLTMGATDVAAHLAVGTTSMNVQVTVNMWLICPVNQTELYEFLLVQEGELISIQDGYIKVLRDEL